MSVTGNQRTKFSKKCVSTQGIMYSGTWTPTHLDHIELRSPAEAQSSCHRISWRLPSIIPGAHVRRTSYLAPMATEHVEITKIVYESRETTTAADQVSNIQITSSSQRSQYSRITKGTLTNDAKDGNQYDFRKDSKYSIAADQATTIQTTPSR